MRRKMKWSFIQNERSRKSTFKKRKKGLLKKLTELVTLCDIKACAVIYNSYDSNPETWPSKEGVEEVVSDFMKLSMEEQSKNMMNQEAFIRQRIAEEQKKIQKLRDENRNREIQNFMFDCLEGKINVHHLDERSRQDLIYGIDMYLSQLKRRAESFTGESSSSLPSHVVADADSPIGFQDHMIQHHNKNDQNEKKPVQFEYKALLNFYDQIPKKIHDFNMNMNSKKSMLLDLNQDLNTGENED
ncbi:MADS-box transcription factor PHERES 2 [Cardamine amara subsp. amara]|uniref:MADS-box transcription factor PHERES 2 n=1 Tax=Cardamine amara subsp. amara TaxID=228776 RepID=A0ABD0Z797_CARAN